MYQNKYRISTKLVPLDLLEPLILIKKHPFLVDKLTILADINKEGIEMEDRWFGATIEKKNGEWGRSADEREIETFPLTQNVVKRLDTKRLLQRDWHEETFLKRTDSKSKF